jgi:hypothetical protein
LASAHVGRLSRLSSGSDNENDGSLTPGGQQADDAASSVYGTPTLTPPSSWTADSTSAQADGASKAADGLVPEAAATAASTNAEVDDTGEAADGVAAEVAATAAGEPLQHAERVDDDDDDDDAPART